MIRAGLAAALVAGAAVGVAARAGADVRGVARLEPGAVRIGEPARYRGAVLFGRDEMTRPRWVPPDSSDGLTWGPLVTRLGRAAAAGAPDTLWVTTTVQAFELGAHTIPGMVFLDEAIGPRSVRRLPATTLRIVSVLTPADSDADLRPVRGPLAAPWWERVPWAWVAGTLALIAAAIWVFQWLRRRRPVVPAPASASAPDPAATALARLATLRARRLPERGAFGEHALELTAVLRRYLESTAGATRPGDTTTEMSERLAGTTLSVAEVEVLLRLLRGWDQVKFARVVPTVEQARRAEETVEAFVRRHAAPAAQEVA